jgi:hypothetical protein
MAKHDLEWIQNEKNFYNKYCKDVDCSKYIDILDRLALTTKAVKALNEAGCNLEERIHSVLGYLPKGGQEYMMCEEALDFWFKAWKVGRQAQVY